MGMWGMTVIYCWDVVSLNTNEDVGNDSNLLLGRGQSNYQWECGDDSNKLLGRCQSAYQ